MSDKPIETLETKSPLPEPAVVTTEKPTTAETKPSLVNELAPEKTAPTPFVPLTADSFKELAPKDVDLVKDPFFNKFLETMNNQELSHSDRATALFKLQGEVLKTVAEQQASDFTKMNDEWRKEVETSYPGPKLVEASSAIGAVIDKYGSPELRAAMDLTGAGNHPAFVKFLVSIAKDLNEPKGDINATLPASQKSVADLIYNNTSKG